MDTEFQYDGVTFVINHKEPCGFVACDHVDRVEYDEETDTVRYHIKRLGLDGDVLKTIVLDDEDIDKGRRTYGFTMYSDKNAALDAARASVPTPEDA